jgi:hypothetical protein
MIPQKGTCFADHPATARPAEQDLNNVPLQPISAGRARQHTIIGRDGELKEGHSWLTRR